MLACVVMMNNPFQPERGREVLPVARTVSVRDWLDGRGIQEARTGGARTGINNDWFNRPTICLHNGQALLRAYWDTTVIGDGDVVAFVALPHGGGGGGGGGKNPLKTVLSIALMVAAPGLGNMLAGSLGLTGSLFAGTAFEIGWGTVLGGVISLAGSALINAVIPAPRPSVPSMSFGAVGAPPAVKLLESGAEPRQALRWNVKPGFEQKVSANIGFAVQTVLAVLTTDSPKTVLSYDLNMKAAKVKGDGTIRVTFKGEVWNTNRKAADRVERVGEPTKLTGSYELDPLGRITHVEIKAPSGATAASDFKVDTLEWALLLLTPAFPNEPVGRGAKWTVHEGVEQGGIHANQLRTIEVVRVEGNRVELDMNVRQAAAPQPFKNPGTGAMLQLGTASGVASGSLTWDLTELAPRVADIDSHMVKGARYGAGQKSADLVIRTNRTIELTAK